MISNHIKFGNFCNFSVHPELINLALGDGLVFRDRINIIVGNQANLEIDNGVFLNNSCSINCLEKIKIGENTLFGESVKLYDHNHQHTAEKVEHQKFNTAPITIGKNCWLGSNVTVLKGVNIGDNSIIGANVLVYKDVPANSIVKLKQDLIVSKI